MPSPSSSAKRVSPWPGKLRPAMGMVVSFFLALAAMVTVYGWLGQGGGVAGLVFFGVLLIGAVLRVAQQQVAGKS